MRTWLQALTSLGLALASTVMANPLSPEERLEAIRQALIERSMQGPTEVRAAAFIDGKGVLREASSFVTGMEVRGVRVLAYGRDTEQQPTAGLSLQNSQPIPPQGCKSPTQATVWHQMAWESGSLQMPVAFQYEAQQVELQLRQMAFAASRQSSAWRLNEQKNVSDTYARLLVGQGEQHVPWLIRVTLTPHRDGGRGLNMYTVRWELVSRQQGVVHFQAEQTIMVAQPALVPVSSRPLAPEVIEQIQSALNAFVKGMSVVLSCRVPQFEVLRVRQDTVRISGGSGSGLRVGASVVLTDKDQLPSRALEPRAFESLAMGEVVSVSEYAAEVKLKTSVKISQYSRWMAVPYMP